MSKPDLPSITSDLAPRRRLDLKAIRSAQVDDLEVAENSRKIGAEWGAQTSLEASSDKIQVTPAELTSPTAKVLLASLRIEVPDYLDRELAFKAVELRCTKQHLVMKALRDAGYRVNDADLVEDKRKTKRQS